MTHKVLVPPSRDLSRTSRPFSCLRDRVPPVFLILILIACLCTVQHARSQDTGAIEKYAYADPGAVKLTGTSTYDIEYKLTFKKTSVGRLTKFILRVAVPHDIPPIQEIVEMKTFPEYEKIEVDKNGNHIAYFSSVGFDKEKVYTFTYRVKTSGYSVVKKPTWGELPSFFIEPEKYVESDDPRIKEASDTICRGKDGVWDKTRAIYDYVRKNTVYTYSWDDLGALYALNNRSGDCSDFSYLMIALCRAQRIPARPVGAFLYDEGAKIYGDNSHQLLEVYLPGIGWVPMDPTRGRHKNNENSCFAGKKDDIIIWYVTDSSDLLEGYSEYYYDCWWEGNDPRPEATPSLKVIKIE